MSKRAVGYIRVSDESQAEPNRASLPEQEKDIREHCHRKGYELLKIFSDVGKRWNANRPEFRRMIAWGGESARPFDVIVVWRADRIVGSASTVAALEPLLDRGGVDIEGASEPMNKGWLLLNALIAKSETEAKIYRGRIGVRTAVERGHYPGIPSYGRRLNKETRKLEINESEARWYREMFGWSIAGEGDARIAGRLNALGVPTRFQGKVTRSGRVIGKGWTTNHVRELLTDASACGEGRIHVKGGDSFNVPPASSGRPADVRAGAGRQEVATPLRPPPNQPPVLDQPPQRQVRRVRLGICRREPQLRGEEEDGRRPDSGLRSQSPGTGPDMPGYA